MVSQELEQNIVTPKVLRSESGAKEGVAGRLLFNWAEIRDEFIKAHGRELNPELGTLWETLQQEVTKFNRSLREKRNNFPAVVPQTYDRMPEVIVMNTATREIQIGDLTHRMKPSAAWEVFKHMAYHPMQRLSSVILTRIASEHGTTQQYPLRNIMAGLRRTLEPNSKNPQLIGRFGPNFKSEYSLNAKVKLLTKPELLKRKKYEVVLTDGKIFKTNGRLENLCLSRLAYTTKDTPLTQKALLSAVYDSSNPERFRKRLSLLVIQVNKKLIPLNWQFVGVVTGSGSKREVVYYMEQIKKDHLIFPGGQVVPKLSKVEEVVLKNLLNSSAESSISTTDLVKAVYGSEKQKDPALRATILAYLRRIRNKMEATDWLIVTLFQPGQEATHYLDQKPHIKAQRQQMEFGQLYEQFYKALYRRASAKVRSEHVSDLVAQAFENGWKAYPRFTPDNPQNPQTSGKKWLFKILNNLIVDYYKSPTRRSISMDKAMEEDEEHRPLQIPSTDRYADPEKMAEIKFEVEALKPALLKLKPDQREAIILHHIDQLDMPDVAAIMSKTEGAVRVILHRGLKKLRSLMITTE